MAAESDRLEALETRFVHQEQTIADLNAAVTAQWREIDALRREIARLREEMQNASARGDGTEPPPPHY